MKLQVFAWILLVFPAASGSVQERSQAPLAFPDELAQISDILGVRDKIDRLIQIPPADRTATMEALSIRQAISEAALATSLEIDGVLAQIDDETAHLSTLRTILDNKRDRRLNILNMANLVAGSMLGVVPGVLGLNESTSKAGSIVDISGGAVSTAFSWIGLRQHGGRIEVGLTPNTLAPIFGRPAQMYGGYSKEMWEFLNTTSSDELKGKSRMAESTEEWTKAGLIPSEKDKSFEKRIDLLTSGISQQRKLSTQMLADRATMLSNVRVEVALMKRDLSALMHFVSALLGN